MTLEIWLPGLFLLGLVSMSLSPGLCNLELCKRYGVPK